MKAGAAVEPPEPAAAAEAAESGTPWPEARLAASCTASCTVQPAADCRRAGSSTCWGNEGRCDRLDAPEAERHASGPC